jgi:hypothetical protein
MREQLWLPHHGGKSALAARRRKRAAEWSWQLRHGDPTQRKTAARSLRKRRWALIGIALRGGGDQCGAKLRLAKATKRHERQRADQWREIEPRLRAARAIGMAQGVCVYFASIGCDCSGYMPDHWVLCTRRGCHCGGALHPALLRR